MESLPTFLPKNSIPSNYNWIGVLEFLQSEYQKTNDRENTWLLEKKNLQTRINELEGELKAADLIAKDLMKRNKMLLKGSSKIQFEESNPELASIPKRKPKSNKATLSKILTSLGIKDIFEDIEREVGLALPDKNMSKHINFEKQIKMLSSNETRKPIESAVQYKNSCTLIGHGDGVRDVYFHPNKSILVSVSEDSLIKLWDTTNVIKQSQSYLTLREHTGPIFTIAGGGDYVFTGGMQGIIRCWSLPSKDEAEAGVSFIRGSWQNSQDEKQQPVWQLLYNQEDNTLFATSSDSTIRMYSINEKTENSKVTQVTSKLKQVYSYRYETSQKFTEEDIPTAISLTELNLRSIVAGFVNTHGLVLFDKETAKIINTMKFTANGQVSTNKIKNFPSFILSAHEDKMIRVFDGNRLTHSFQAHDDSVVSLASLPNQNEFISCSHDSTIKRWDVRKFEALQTLEMHTRKYDEAIHGICSHPIQNLFASAGADSTIKLYVPQ